MLGATEAQSLAAATGLANRLSGWLLVQGETEVILRFPDRAVPTAAGS